MVGLAGQAYLRSLRLDENRYVVVLRSRPRNAKYVVETRDADRNAQRALFGGTKTAAGYSCYDPGGGRNVRR